MKFTCSKTGSECKWEELKWNGEVTVRRGEEGG